VTNEGVVLVDDMFDQITVISKERDRPAGQVRHQHASSGVHRRQRQFMRQALIFGHKNARRDDQRTPRPGPPPIVRRRQSIWGR
jgi:hypothetical protein